MARSSSMIRTLTESGLVKVLSSARSAVEALRPSYRSSIHGPNLRGVASIIVQQRGPTLEAEVPQAPRQQQQRSPRGGQRRHRVPVEQAEPVFEPAVEQVPVPQGDRVRLGETPVAGERRERGEGAG